jgi:hypothetical protein
MQVPFVQVCPEAQACPQVPQLLTSVCVFTQSPLQATFGAVQEVVQVPFEQTCPEAQACPQVPQLLLSVWVLVQTPLQVVFGAVQAVVQVPPVELVQVVPVAQVPQFCAFPQESVKLPQVYLALEQVFVGVQVGAWQVIEIGEPNCGLLLPEPIFIP